MTEITNSGQIDQKFAIGFLLAFALTVAIFLILQISSVNEQVSLSFAHATDNTSGKRSVDDKLAVEAVKGIKQFSSEEDFKKFLADVQMTKGLAGGLGTGIGGGKLALDTAQPQSANKAVGSATATAGSATGSAPQRVSETNVQVSGIDEPDIVKTDGNNIYYSPPMSYYWTSYDRVVGSAIKNGVPVLPSEPLGETGIIGAFPPDQLAKDGSIPSGGDLLLAKNKLAVFSNNQINGYDITDQKKPVEIWKIRLEDNNQLVGSRLYNDKIYLVSKTVIDVYHPCPIRPLTASDSPVIVQCNEIYHPDPNFSADVIYTALIVDAASGNIEKSLSFVASSGNSILYMSKDGIYITWGYSGDYIKFYFDFLTEKAA
ncbi:MAG: beta-propeller domain-containing protein, partial [Candidatus Nealsonbacteria bacterium]|nr:beta-propeller domain-containing protein [Candidatus Nealsonbacteria bacterium]